MSQALPNFLHIGPSKTGSTWLHEVLISHPEIYFTHAKDLYFFSRYYERGLDWYATQFAGVEPQHKVIGEVSPDYLACPEAPERILDCLGPDVRMMVTLREPASRAFSSYLYLSKHGLAAATFRDTARTSPDLIDEGRYATHLRRYLRNFDRKALHIAVFDDLEDGPQAFLDEVTDWLNIERHAISPEQLEARLPASSARWLPLAVAAKRSANWVRRHDGAGLVGKVKRSALVQRTLYKPLGTGRPTISPEDIAFVREQLAGEIAGVEEEFGISLRQRWGWQ
ncbi:MAG TPA: sulfotransferase [Streptosporangiaceae bacterium]|nr:sulfotransferase [Streptosporangiaceae bacterium]